MSGGIDEIIMWYCILWTLSVVPHFLRKQANGPGEQGNVVRRGRETSPLSSCYSHVRRSRSLTPQNFTRNILLPFSWLILDVIPLEKHSPVLPDESVSPWLPPAVYGHDMGDTTPHTVVCAFSAPTRECESLKSWSVSKESEI